MTGLAGCTSLFDAGAEEGVDDDEDDDVDADEATTETGDENAGRTTTEETPEPTDVDGGGTAEAEIRAVIQEQVRAFANGSVDRYMETMHPESPIYDETRRSLESSYEQTPPSELTASATVESVDIVGRGRAEAVVVQITRADTEGFRDNRLTQLFNIRQYQGEWLVYDSTLNEVEYL